MQKFTFSAILVHVFLANNKNIDDLNEFIELAKSSSVDIAEVVTTARHTPNPKYFIGSGKTEELASLVTAHKADIILVNHELSPSQTRNLEDACNCRVVDRTGLILDIFAQRARSHEGKLQVELAQLQHLSARLTRRTSGLDQQKGGVGLRGPGETQLETDRRLIKVKISQLSAKLAKVAQQRNQNRQTRKKTAIPTISLIGYTNAGKSSLFNRLTEADTYVADQLFATLDPTLRRLFIKNVGTTILADTVGFIRDLPHELVDAFKSTLQETNEASLLLHVIDITDARIKENIHAVQDVLAQIDADEIPTLLVFNKIDKADNYQAKIEFNQDKKPYAVYLSAQTGDGTDLLLEAIQLLLEQNVLIFDLVIRDEKLRHLLYENKYILQESINKNGEYQLKIEIPKIELAKLHKQFPLLTKYFPTSSNIK